MIRIIYAQTNVLLDPAWLDSDLFVIEKGLHFLLTNKSYLHTISMEEQASAHVDGALQKIIPF